MSSFGRCWRAALVLGGLGGSSLAASAQAPSELLKPVQLTPGRRSLGAVLAELSRQSQLPFSYSSSLVPLAHRYQVRPGPARPAGVVLREVLATEHLSYGVLAGQVVLWPGQAPTPPGVTAVNGETAGTSMSSTGKTPAGIALHPIANTAPALPLEKKRFTPLIATKTTGRPAASRQPNGSAGFGSITPAVRKVVEPKSTTAINRPGATPGSRLVKPPARRKPIASKGAAATSPPTSAASSTGIAASSAFQLGYSARYRAGKPVGRISKRASQHAAAARAETPYSAAARARYLAPLPLKQVDLELVNQANPLPPTLSLPAGGLVEVAVTPPAPNRPIELGTSRKSLYLHGEAWASESLPVGAVAKVGVARAYLVLGVAVGSPDRHAGLAWGVGLGTAGRARGRFTPSLDVVQWFLPGGGDDGRAALTQLRPLLAWQLTRTGRLALLAGPTFNLATTDADGPQRGNFGRRQWLWVDGGNEHSSVRFWPGVQVGLRF